MFKFTTYLYSDGSSANPFSNAYIRSFLRDGVVIMSQSMHDMVCETNDFNLFESKMVIIGEGAREGVTFVQTVEACVKHLSDNYITREWWFVGDNAMANDLILKGLIMDVHLVKNYTQEGSAEWARIIQNALPPSAAFNKANMNKFDLISTVVSHESAETTIRHYIRRNMEETHLLGVMNEIITHGFKRPNRTGVDTRALFGKQFEYHMYENVDVATGRSSFRLPLLTTKRMFIRGVFGELIWFLRGGTNSKDLEAQGINIWKGNTSRAFLDKIGLDNYDEGEGGPIYGFQWRHFGAKYIQGKSDYTGEGVDQVQQVIDSLQTDPFGRRHIINAWNASDLSKMCLSPCHVLYQFLVHEKDGQKYLTLSMYQRSCDVFLGLPFNICSMGMLLLMMSHRVGMKPWKLIHSVADAHLYETHIEAATKQTHREPCMFPYISINCEPKDKLEDYQFSDITIDNYFHHSAIKADMVA